MGGGYRSSQVDFQGRGADKAHSGPRRPPDLFDLQPECLSFVRGGEGGGSGNTGSATEDIGVDECAAVGRADSRGALSRGALNEGNFWKNLGEGHHRYLNPASRLTTRSPRATFPESAAGENAVMCET